MSEMITLTCHSCGGTLKITSEIDRFSCTHCGNEYWVRRGEGIISLDPVVQSIENVQTGVDKTASELAINRLKNEIREFELEKENLLQTIEDIPNINERKNFGIITAILVISVAIFLYSMNINFGLLLTLGLTSTLTIE